MSVADVSAVIDEEGQKIFEQEKFYYDRFFQLVLLILLTIGLCLGAFGMIYLLRDISSPAPVYFNATEKGGLIEELPLDISNMDSNVLLNWVTEAMMASSTFNFINYQTILNNAKTYYTKEGFDSYNTALVNAKVVDRVVQKKYVLHSVPTDAPQVLLEKPFAGRYMWKIKMPMRFKYQNVTDNFGDAMDITLIVMRVPVSESENGVSILKYDLQLNNDQMTQ